MAQENPGANQLPAADQKNESSPADPAPQLNQPGDPPPPQEAEPPQLIFPTGPPLRIPAESVQLTFLDPASVPEPEVDDDAGPFAGIELRTSLGIKLPVFDGPLDLLLHLIRRDELDIYDIPIGHITEQYLSMLGLMQVLDLEVAGEFLVMAATLMRIKSRLLLPSLPEDDEDDGDPRLELLQQLLEYRKFKSASQALKEKEERRRLTFARGTLPEFEEQGEVELAPISHFALIDVMKDVLARVGEEFLYEVELEDVTLEEKIELVSSELQESGRVLFADLIARHPRRLHVVVTFMAILEMARLGKLAIAQEGTFGQIWVYPVREGKILGPGERLEPGADAESTISNPLGEADHDGTA